nr:DUF3301 domain-containing protein [Allofrancisella inopinata]
MKNKELAISVAERSANKYNLDLLDDTVCLRKINIKLKNYKIAIYRIYSFDYNTLTSSERFRAYIVLRNGKLDDIVISEYEKADIVKENIGSEQVSPKQAINNIIKFDE